ncbi:unnamed protein product [Symbiodinium microadriaticum]|nr:unnamed protein product [Symbiodinium microadriaticum]
MLCVDLEKTGDAHPLAHRVRPKAAKDSLRGVHLCDLRFLEPKKEKFYFRFLGGPQNRLAWALDPEHGKARTAIWRLRRCVVGLQMEDAKALGPRRPFTRRDSQAASRIKFGNSVVGVDFGMLGDTWGQKRALG